MQRLFTMFPRGLPGLGLLLLRASVATGLLLECYTNRVGQSGWVHGVALLLAVTLCVGYMTPIAAVTAIVVHVVVWSGVGVPSASFVAIVVLDALALALLGPGSYSVDSRRYGRRIVVTTPP